VIFVAFKAIDPVLRGQDGGFDSHTLPPHLPQRRRVTGKRGGKRRHKRNRSVLFVEGTGAAGAPTTCAVALMNVPLTDLRHLHNRFSFNVNLKSLDVSGTSDCAEDAVNCFL
jgi:hypothetical protein